jgi:hypothetical protein
LKYNKIWQRNFDSVEVIDDDYEQAGGPERMSQFNALTTLKKICKDFNRNDEQAWQMPHYMVQTNNYSDACYSFTQSEMSRLKEIRMRQKRAEGFNNLQ